jgi:hypothetical protein
MVPTNQSMTENAVCDLASNNGSVHDSYLDFTHVSQLSSPPSNQPKEQTLLHTMQYVSQSEST